jgi:hypothetical protein
MKTPHVLLFALLAAALLSPSFGCGALYDRLVLVADPTPIPSRLSDDDVGLLDTVTENGTPTALLPGDCISLKMLAPTGLAKQYQRGDRSFGKTSGLRLCWRDYPGLCSPPLRLADGGFCPGRRISLAPGPAPAPEA